MRLIRPTHAPSITKVLLVDIAVTLVRLPLGKARKVDHTHTTNSFVSVKADVIKGTSFNNESSSTKTILVRLGSMRLGSVGLCFSTSSSPMALVDVKRFSIIFQ